MSASTLHCGLRAVIMALLVQIYDILQFQLTQNRCDGGGGWGGGIILFSYYGICLKYVWVCGIKVCNYVGVFFLFFFIIFFINESCYHGPGIGRIKMPLGVEDPLGQ